MKLMKPILLDIQDSPRMQSTSETRQSLFRLSLENIDGQQHLGDVQHQKYHNDQLAEQSLQFTQQPVEVKAKRRYIRKQNRRQKMKLKCVFTKQEDDKVQEIVTLYGCQFSKYCRLILKKTLNQIKNRYYKHLRNTQEEFEMNYHQKQQCQQTMSQNPSQAQQWRVTYPLKQLQS